MVILDAHTPNIISRHTSVMASQTNDILSV